MDLELIALNIIAHSGTARTKAFEALAKAREGEYSEVKKLLLEADESSILAHNAQTELLQAEANGEGSKYSLILVHAQDHLMSSILAKELIQEMVKLYEDLKK